MAIQPRELEGTWEEILAHGDELAGRRVRVMVLSDDANITNAADATNATDAKEQEYPYSTAGALLKHAGKWAGDDLEECLRAVYENRTQAKF